MNELASLDAELHRNLLFIKNYEGNFADLDLTFTIVDDVSGSNVERELVPNGRAMAVTRENRMRYIYTVVNHRLNLQTRAHIAAFRNGFAILMDLRYLKFFDVTEFQQLLSGKDALIDIEDLKQNTHYAHWTDDNPTVQIFWEVVRGFSNDEIKSLLKFATGCPRPPFQGFRALNPPFQIVKYLFSWSMMLVLAHYRFTFVEEALIRRASLRQAHASIN
jgi:ubiquitin-protein ligase E3 C